MRATAGRVIENCFIIDLFIDGVIIKYRFLEITRVSPFSFFFAPRRHRSPTTKKLIYEKEKGQRKRETSEEEEMEKEEEEEKGGEKIDNCD